MQYQREETEDREEYQEYQICYYCTVSQNHGEDELEEKARGSTIRYEDAQR